MILFTEDVLLENAIRKIASEKNNDLEISSTMGNRGFSYFFLRRAEIGRSARSLRFLIALDGDELRGTCAGDAIRSWFGSEKPQNLCIRFAYQEVENWLLSDRTNLADFLGISPAKIPLIDDTCSDAKEMLVQLARSSRNREIREDLVPQSGHTAKIGPAYNLRMREFIVQHWDIDAACTQSESLLRACREIGSLDP